MTVRLALARVVAATLVALTGVLGASSAASAAEPDTIHELVNQSRWDNGQAGLIRNAELDAVAAAWAGRMAELGSLQHNPNLASEIPAGWNSYGENVAQGYANGSAVHTGWMNSPGHRANVLGDYTDIGIAFVSIAGTTWGVEVFARYPGHVGPPRPVPVADPAPVAPAPEVPSEPTPTAPPAEPSPRPTATPRAGAVPGSSPPPATGAGELTSASAPLAATGGALAIGLLLAAALGVRALLRSGRTVSAVQQKITER